MSSRAGELARPAISLRFGDRHTTVMRKSAAPHTPTAIEPYQTRRTRVSAATAPKRNRDLEQRDAVGEPMTLMQLVGVDIDFFGHAIPPRPRRPPFYRVASAASSAALISCSWPPKK